MSIGVLTLHLLIPGCTSLKEKRSHIKPLLTRLHREFNISVSEVDCQDMWQESVLACAQVSNDHGYTQMALQSVLDFLPAHFPNVEVIEHHIELL
jgi:uncharacterized protein YlxP (DUF503 family)